MSGDEKGFLKKFPKV